MPREYQAERYGVDTFKLRSRYGEVSRKIRGRNGVATGKVRGRYVQSTSKLQTTQPFKLWELMEYEAPKYEKNQKYDGNTKLKQHHYFNE